ncbi:MAG: condensation domain-containing protein, partial [Pyrinomonadaceae bacterium]
GGERQYLTGDLGRYMGDGEIEFMGREDLQVKVGGHRIEIGEVEAALGEHEGVREAVVAALGERQGVKRLVAFVVPHAERQLASAELRVFLKSKLPEYMIPSSFVYLDGLPLTDNGKIDRRALPALAAPSALAAPDSAAPPGATAFMTKVGLVFEEVLGKKGLDPHDDLLGLGANSLDFIRIAGLLEKQFGFRPEMEELFQLQTIAEVSSCYEKHMLRNANASEVGGDDARHRRMISKLLLDPTEREEFKEAQHGLEPLREGTTWLRLPRASEDEARRASYEERRSYRKFSRQPIALAQFGDFLSGLCGLTLNGHPKFLYGSAGSTYSVQTYLYIKTDRVEGFSSGGYYYHPAHHQLMPVADTASVNRKAHFFDNRAIFDESAFALFFVCKLDAIAPLYGGKSRDYGMLEAGLMTQLLESSAPAHGIGLCQIGDLNFDIQASFGLTDNYLLLHSMLGGRIDAGGTGTLSAEMKRESMGVASAPTIVAAPGDRYQPFPLTDIQQAYWIGRGSNFEMGNVPAHGYIEIDFTNVDIERLSQAWQRMIERHDMLKMVVLPDGQQQILEGLPPYQFEIVDLRGADSQTVASRLDEARTQLSHRMLPAEQWPLFEIRAHLLDGGRARLHFGLDLLIADATSNLIIAKEWVDFYEDEGKGLPPLEITYRDYVLAESKYRESEAYQRAMDHWRSRLDAIPPPPDLPLSKSPSALTQPRFKRWAHRLAPESWQQLKERASRAGLTPSILLCAAYAEVLAVWSRSPRFTINVPLFNRLPLHPQVRDLIGQFSSFNLLAVDYSVPETFEVRARRLQQQLWIDQEHTVSGIEVLRERARRMGDPSKAAMPVIFTTTIGLDIPSLGALPLAKLGKLVYSITQTPQVWLDNQVAEEDGALVLNWDAVEELFPDGLLDSMFSAYCQFLQRLADDDSLWHSS